MPDHLLNLEVEFDDIFYGNPQPLLVFDAESLRVVNVNDAACRHYGYTREEFLQLYITDIRPVNEHEKLLKTLESVMGNMHKKRPFVHVKKDGTPIQVDIISYKIVFEGRPARLVIPIDVTEQLHNKEQLEAALKNMEHTLESISDGHFTLSHTGTVISWNKSAEAFTRINKADILNKIFWEVVPDALESGFYRHVEKALTGSTVVKFEEHFPKLNKWFYTSVYPAADHISIYFQDITEIKRHQQELRLKNQHLRELAYFNSHELRRPIANIMGLHNLLASLTDAGTAEKEEIIHKIQQSCAEIDQVIKQIDQHHFSPQNFFTPI